MRRPFKSTSGGVEVMLGSEERELLVHLLEQLDDLLDDGRVGSDDPLVALVGFDPSADGPEPTTPQDPALARLLPDAHREDPTLAAEFRRLTEPGLRSRKRAGARQAARALTTPERRRPVLAETDAVALLTSLTDLRLVLAERLELRSEDDVEQLTERLRSAGVGAGADAGTDADADPSGEGSRRETLAAMVAIYDVLSWWQESLVAALTARQVHRSSR